MGFYQFILLLFTLFAWESYPATSVNYYVTRGSAGELFLVGENCKDLQKQALALKKWTALLNEKTDSILSCTCNSLKCFLNIHKVTPEFVKKFQGQNAGRWGPNCWNASLVANKILPALRFSPPEEMSFWMNSPLCRKLSANEPAKPGDIVTIRDKDKNEIHGFIYVSKELSFSKNYLTTRAPYELQPTQNVFQNFPVPLHCRKMAKDGDVNCSIFANYFRCQTMQEYLTKNPTSQEFNSTDKKIADAEALLSEILFNWNDSQLVKRTSPMALAEIQREMRSIIRSLEEQSVNPNLSDSERFLWRSLVIRVQSLIQSIEWI